MNHISDFCFKSLTYFIRLFGLNQKYTLLKKSDLIDMKTILQKIKPNVEEFSTVIDIGASDGRWTKDLLDIYPNIKSLMIEANPFHEESLKKFISEHPNTIYELCAAGDEDGMIYFDNSDPFGGLASHEKINGIEVPVRKPDDLVKKYNLQGKYLLKTDTHGFELPILQGSKEILKDCALIVMETYNFKIAKDSLKFWEMCKYLDDLGFSPDMLCHLSMANSKFNKKRKGLRNQDFRH